MMNKNENNVRVLIFVACFFLMLITACDPDKPVDTPKEYGSVTDIEGNTYQTIKIGNQWWMVENLKVTKYRDDTPIPQVLLADSVVWKEDTLGAYSLNDVIPGAPGLLYNWHTISNARGIAPAGWHVPSDEEWKELEKYLGMTQEEADKSNFRGIDEAGKLKSDQKDTWAPYGNIWSTNESGFTALAGNCRMFYGAWGTPSDFRSTGFWWSSTPHTGTEEAWYRHLDYKKLSIFRYYGPKTYGFSVRCIKD